MVDVSHRMKNYFLGAIILKQTSTGAATMGDHKIVIDGQQRLDHVDHGDGSVGPFLVVLTIISGSQSLRARNDCSTNN